MTPVNGLRERVAQVAGIRSPLVEAGPSSAADEDGRRLPTYEVSAADRTGLAGYLVATAYNLVRLSRLAGRQRAIPAAA